MPKKQKTKKFKYLFDIVQALVFPFALVIVTWLGINIGYVAEESVKIVWTVIIISVVASIVSILVAAWIVDYS